MGLTERNMVEHNYLILSARLTELEMTCLAYCQICNDCAADGECELQERAANIIAENTNKT
jgi:hypothetical protein